MIRICIKRVSKYCEKSSTASPHRQATFQDWVCPACAAYLHRKYDMPTAVVIPSKAAQDLHRLLGRPKTGG